MFWYNRSSDCHVLTLLKYKQNPFLFFMEEEVNKFLSDPFPQSLFLHLQHTWLQVSRIFRCFSKVVCICENKDVSSCNNENTNTVQSQNW